MIIQIEAVHDAPDLRRSVARLLEFDKAGGIKTKIKESLDTHTTDDTDVQAWVYRIGFLIGKFKIKVRQVIPEQINRLTGN